MQIIPITNDVSQGFVTTLEGQVVELNLRYQSIGEGWYITIKYNGVDIITGQRLNNQSRLVRDLISDFEGEIAVVPSTSPPRELGRDAWGNTHKLIYLNNDELATL